MNQPSELFLVMAKMSDAMSRVGIRYGRRMLGRPWAFGNYWLGSYVYIENGLDAVTYVVIERDSGTYMGHGDSKGESIGRARNLVAMLQGSVAELIRTVAANREAEIAQFEDQRNAMRLSSAVDVPEKKIPKRRLEIFNKSNGQCHYCSTPLELRGKWHIEHMMPRALGGSNEPGNLVAACVPCNIKKKDKTAEEFIHDRTKVAALEAAA